MKEEKLLKVDNMKNDLQTLREKIDVIDEQLLALIKERVATTGEIGKIKKENNHQIRDFQRENEKLQSLETKAKTLNLPAQLIKNIWNAFFEISEDIQK